ncbi:putative DELLA protein GAI [Tripterygium wilfordii]|uniref:Putative DELLA protein GAI n=1 Tax=Tripterygium wilfordii TaxID=458696 RepID=A0A7J7CE15_TRIWF|nr:scarecrow-like protein 8 [Tripterygium wilfordii]KAF5732379.1 putative DELLA protein GAI [Tripterygium wilfordii]
MASEFSGGGPEFYSAGRSINTAMTSNVSQSPYRSQLSQIFLDPASQITQQRTANQSLIGKRTLTDFQSHQTYQTPQQLNRFFPRSVKPRMYQNTSPISTLSPIELSANLSSDVYSLSSISPASILSEHRQRCGLRPLQRQMPHHLSPMNAGPVLQSGVPYMNDAQKGIASMNNQESEKMLNRLQELEKQLLDDNDDDEGDAVSVITNINSEWSETIQNLFSSSSPSAISTSPTNSSTSSYCSLSSSAATPVSNCSKETVIEAATAIYDGKAEAATEILTRLSQFANRKGNSEQRVTEYMSLALKSRSNSFDSPPPVAEMYGNDHIGSIQLLYDISPCFKLGFVAANQAILDATLDEPNTDKFHVVDFDIGQGDQYVNLLHALSSRRKPPVTFKITAVSDNGSEERLRLVGDMLSQQAKRVGSTLHFNVAVGQKISNLSRESLGCEPDEPLAVNFAFNLYRMPDESVSTENPRDELLRRVKGLAPRVVTLVEQEINTNTAPFVARVGEVWSYYGALFDSIESTVARDSAERVKVEEGLGRKLGNSVACEGRDRLERCEVFGKWRARMGMAGFNLKPMSPNLGESMRARLSSGNRPNPGFTVKEENGGVCFGWMGRTLTVASAWS